MNSPVVNHLLHCVSEECAEIAKESSKAGRFGTHDTHPTDGDTNIERLNNEYNDLYAVLEMLSVEIDEDLLVLDREKIWANKIRCEILWRNME